MIYSNHMVIKRRYNPPLGLILLFSFILMGCPENEYSDACRNQWKVMPVSDLVTIRPLQEVYHLGDSMTVEISIDSQSDFFDEPVDIYEYTLAEEVRMLGGLNLQGENELYENNFSVSEGDLRLNDGSQGVYLLYDPDDDKYKFKIIFEFTEVGEYRIPNNFDFQFSGEYLCQFVWLKDSDILGIPDNQSYFTFNVVP